MDNLLLYTHNAHKQDAKQFAQIDPQLRKLAHLPFPFQSPLLDKLPIKTPGIYTLGGGHQIGKSTLLKQWMLKLLDQGVEPECLTFLSGEVIADEQALIGMIQELLKQGSQKLKYLIIDEVTYIKRWEYGVKFLADAGLLENTVLMLSGSDLTILQDARMVFPGRRGRAEQFDFHLYPLSFSEFVGLTSNFDQAINDQYLLHGGYLTAINEYAEYGSIHQSILKTYSDWIRGDMLRHQKQEKYLKEIIGTIIKRYGSQLSWHALGKDLSIDHHKTVADYCEILEKMDALTILYALDENKLVAAPKKSKKLYFNDPFVFHALNYWVNNSWGDLENPELVSELVEGVLVEHYKRFYSVYYLKAKYEIDLAYIEGKKIFPIELKWTSQLHPEDFKAIKSYRNSVLLTKLPLNKKLDGVLVRSLSLQLLLHKFC